MTFSVSVDEIADFEHVSDAAEDAGLSERSSLQMKAVCSWMKGWGISQKVMEHDHGLVGGE